MKRTAKRKATSPPLALAALVLTTLIAVYYSGPANAQQYPDPGQYALQGSVTATGVLEGPVQDGGQDPTPQYRLTDEATGTTYTLMSGFVDLQDYAGQRVTITGTPAPGVDPLALDVTDVWSVDDPNGGGGQPVGATGVLERAAPHGQDPTPIYAITDEATGTPYELISGFVELEPFVGQAVTIEGVPVPGDPPPGAPVFLNVTSIVPVGDPGGGQEVTATGLIEPLEATSFGYGTHALKVGGAPVYALESQSVDLGDHAGEQVTIYGALVPGYEDGLDGGPPLVEVSRVEAAPPDGETHGFRGTVTAISGPAVLVEEDPSEEGSGDKGYFTVTEETGITERQEGERVPAAFEDLEVGQLVEASYAGPIAESYPTQGDAASIVILGGDGGGEEERATLSFELTVEGEPPPNAAFFGFVPAEGGMSAPLADQDGDGLYTGSMTVDRFGPGPRPVPPGTEPVSLPVRIAQATGVVKDFGLVRIDGDKTFEASVSFGDNGGDGGSDNSGSDGTGPGGIRVLPATGGALAIEGLVGALLVAASLLARRVLR